MAEKDTIVVPAPSGRQNDDYFSWEASYSKLWSVILEDESDNIQNSINKFNAMQRKRLTRNISLIPGLKKGLIRNFIIIIEASQVANETDLYPTRIKWILNKLAHFARDYFDQNPLCQLGIIITRDGMAERLYDLSTIENVLSKSIEGQGDASFKNALDLSMSLFGNIPSHVSKEVLLIQLGLSTCDAGDIRETCEQLKVNKVKASVISLLGQVYFSENIARITGGSYEVVLNDDHFARLIMQHVQPPSMLLGEQKSLGYLVQMGFPRIDPIESEFLCLCHGRPSKGGFTCPRCATRVCSIPSDCPACQLTLISSSHLARSYHHLFPVPQFEELDVSMEVSSHSCFSCKAGFFQESSTLFRHKCTDCQELFCSKCDAYIHDHLHNCPGCLNK